MLIVKYLLDVIICIEELNVLKLLFENMVLKCD